MTIQITSAMLAAERPLELLYACHEKVRRFNALAWKLAGHVETLGADEQARDAAKQILRYFEMSLPHHHADEELDVFPALRDLNDAALSAAITELEAEHVALEALWQEVGPWLHGVAQGETVSAPASLSQFVAHYVMHTDREEREVFSAIERLPDSLVDAIAQRMRARRGG